MIRQEKRHCEFHELKMNQRISVGRSRKVLNVTRKSYVYAVNLQSRIHYLIISNQESAINKMFFDPVTFYFKFRVMSLLVICFRKSQDSLHLVACLWQWIDSKSPASPFFAESLHRILILQLLFPGLYSTHRLLTRSIRVSKCSALVS